MSKIIADTLEGKTTATSITLPTTIVTDTLQGKTSATSITLPTTTNIGATPLVSASANSMSIRGEGSNTTNVQQGLCKAWIEMTGTGTIAINDSFNFSSITDLNVGQYSMTFATNMGNATYSIQAHDIAYGNGWSDSDSASGFQTRRRSEAGSYVDCGRVWTAIFGDLS